MMCLAELSMVSSRFSEYEEDHKNLANGFSTKEEVKIKAEEVFDVLKDIYNCNML